METETRYIMTNTIKISVIKKAICDYKRANRGGFYSPRYGYLMLDRRTGEVWTDEFYSLGHGDWIQYHSPAIINLGRRIEDNNDEITIKTVRAYAETACAEYAE